MPGNAGAAEGLLSTFTEAQVLQFVPTLAPRGANHGFVPAVVPNQLTSTPSGTVFPNSTYPIRTEAVPVLSGRTVNVPLYDAASGNRSFREALSLPPKARADIAGTLLRSLDVEDEPGVEAAWAIEIERRLKDVESGKVKLVPWGLRSTLQGGRPKT